MIGVLSIYLSNTNLVMNHLVSLLSKILLDNASDSDDVKAFNAWPHHHRANDVLHNMYLFMGTSRAADKRLQLSDS